MVVNREVISGKFDVVSPSGCVFSSGCSVISLTVSVEDITGVNVGVLDSLIIVDESKVDKFSIEVSLLEDFVTASVGTSLVEESESIVGSIEDPDSLGGKVGSTVVIIDLGVVDRDDDEVSVVLEDVYQGSEAGAV